MLILLLGIIGTAVLLTLIEGGDTERSWDQYCNLECIERRQIRKMN